MESRRQGMFLDMHDASPEEVELLLRLQLSAATDHSKVQLPAYDSAAVTCAGDEPTADWADGRADVGPPNCHADTPDRGQPAASRGHDRPAGVAADDVPEEVQETCRLPPDGIEFAADEVACTAAVPAPGQHHHIQGLLGEMPPPPVGGLMQAQHPVMPGMLPGGPQPLYHQQQQLQQQQPGYQAYHNMFVNNMMPYPGGYPMHGYPMQGYPQPEPHAEPERRRAGKADKAPAPSYPPYHISTRAATGSPLVMSPCPPAGFPIYQLSSYPYYPYPYQPEMMPMPPALTPPPLPPPPQQQHHHQQLQQLQQQQMEMKVPPPATPPTPAVESREEDTRAQLCEPDGRVQHQESESEPELEPELELELEPEPEPTPEPEPEPDAPRAPVRLVFGFGLEDKVCSGDSQAVQVEAYAYECAGGGRVSPAALAAPASYVATVTVSERVAMPLPDGSTAAEFVSGSAADCGRAQAGVEPEEAPPPTAAPAAAELPAELPAAVNNGQREQEPTPTPIREQEPAPPQEQEPAPPREQEPALTQEPKPAPVPAPEPAAVSAPAPRSWASLFVKKPDGVAPSAVALAPPKPAPPPVVPDTDAELLLLGAALSQFELCYKAVPLQPRGLTNKSNWCYINATLQALASCTPFFHLMKELPFNVGLQTDRSRTPIINAMVEFISELQPMQEVPRVTRRERERGQLRDLALGAPFEPSYVYAMLSKVSSDAFRVAGRQEDAEEFLTCLLSGLQDEMTEVLKVYEKSRKEGAAGNGTVNGADRPPTDEEDGDDWQTIVGKSRGQVTRSAELQSTPISRVFSGQLRSSLHRPGSKATATVQSFFSLQLDIQAAAVSSVEEALEQLVCRDAVVGLTCPQTGQPVDAWQQEALELTPPILILHLKRFLYDPATDRVQKLLKRVSFPVDLDLKRELLSAARSKLGPGPKRYRLFAVVYHAGNESSKGHYLTDAFHPAYQQWVRYDDSTVSAVPEATVLRPEPPLMPYILFYRRLDAAK